MKRIGSLDYMILQNGISLIIQNYNKEISHAVSIVNGIGERRIVNNMSLFFAENNGYEKSFLAAERANEIFSFSQEYVDLIDYEFKKIQRNITYNIVLRIENRHDTIFLDRKEEITNEHNLTTAEITFYIEKGNRASVIKRDYYLKKNIQEELLKHVRKLVEEYSTYVKLPEFQNKKDKYDLLLPSGRGGILIHETIGHALEADHFFSCNTVLKNMMYKRIGCEEFSVSDCRIVEGIVDVEYADDGSIAKTVNLINNGIIENVLTDRLTAKRWKLENTGNGRSQSFYHPVIPRMRNTFLHNGNYAINEIFDATKCGIYVLDIGGGQTDIVTGNFVFNVYSGYYIKNGVPVAAVGKFLFKGNIFDAIKSIDMIGNDLAFQNGICGKKGQIIPVSYGQPTIRLRKQSIES